MHADHLARMLEVPDLGANLGDVERCLEHALDSPTALAAPSRRVIDAGGRRLRPALTIACAGLGGIYDQRVVAAATAAELVQVGSLVHDDLLDGALTRRGTPTITAVEGASTACSPETSCWRRPASSPRVSEPAPRRSWRQRSASCASERRVRWLSSPIPIERSTSTSSPSGERRRRRLTGIGVRVAASAGGRRWCKTSVSSAALARAPRGRRGGRDGHDRDPRRLERQGQSASWAGNFGIRPGGCFAEGLA